MPRETKAQLQTRVDADNKAAEKVKPGQTSVDALGETLVMVGYSDTGIWGWDLYTVKYYDHALKGWFNAEYSSAVVARMNWK